jgi:hypothetical protein
MSRFGGMILLAAVLVGNAAAALAGPPPGPKAQTEDDVKTLALHWYTQMQAGQLDRAQLAAAYSAQLSDDAVREMSRRVNLYGASPTSAEILQTRSITDQTFYLVKLIFPRGDAASLLIGFDAQGKITGINLMSMAGD